MNAIITCNYCNKIWDQYIYSTGRNLKCSKCGETKSLAVKKAANDQVDYYIGTPEFPSNNDDIGYSYEPSDLMSNPEDRELTSD